MGRYVKFLRGNKATIVAVATIVSGRQIDIELLKTLFDAETVEAMREAETLEEKCQILARDYNGFGIREENE